MVEQEKEEEDEEEQEGSMEYPKQFIMRIQLKLIEKEKKGLRLASLGSAWLSLVSTGGTLRLALPGSVWLALVVLRERDRETNAGRARGGGMRRSRRRSMAKILSNC